MGRLAALASGVVLLGAISWHLPSGKPVTARRSRPKPEAKTVPVPFDPPAESGPDDAEAILEEVRAASAYDDVVRVHERLDAAWPRLSEADRAVAVRLFVRLLHSDAPRDARQDAAGFLGRRARASDLEDLVMSDLAVEVLVEVFRRERDPRILEALRAMARSEPSEATGPALEVLVSEDAPLAAEAWLRYVEAELPRPEGARTLFANLAAHLDDDRIARLERLRPDADVAMILDSVGRPGLRQSMSEARWRAWEAGRTEAAGDLLRLRDPRIGPALRTALRGGGPVSRERAHELLRGHTGADISALRLRVGIEVPDEEARWHRIASEWDAWWAREGGQ